MFLTKAQNQDQADKPIALVFTDVVGSAVAKRATELGDTTSLRDRTYLDVVQTRHLQLVRQCVAAHHGREIMTIGDAFFLTFEEVHEAVLCAAEIQTSLKSEPIPTAVGPLRLRIGIHVGTPKYFENSWHGTDVDTAARAEAIGSSGQIILTQAARFHFGDVPGITIRPLGDFALKGIGNVPLWDVDYDHHGPRQPAFPSVHTASRRLWLRRGRTAALALLVLLIAAAAYRWEYRRTPQTAAVQNSMAPKDSIILAGIDNQTGEPVFDSMLTEAFAIQLEQSPVLNLISQQHLRQSMQYLGRKPDDKITPALAREIGVREGVKAVLDGSVVKFGSGYVVTLTAQNTLTGDDLAHEQAEAPDQDHVLAAVSKVAAGMRAHLGESLSSIEKLDTPFGQATTTSLEAFRAYALGDVEHEKGLEIPEAEGHYQDAVELDPHFAMAWARLGVVHENAGLHSKSTQEFTRAYELSNNVSERERLYIQGHYENAVSGNLDKEMDTLQLAIKTYPLTNDNYDNLGVVQGHLGRPEDSLKSYLKGIEADPSDAVTRENLMYAYLDLDRFQDAANTSAIIHNLHNDDGTTYLIDLYYLQFIQGDTAGMAKTAARVEGRPDQMQFTQTIAFVAEFTGRYRDADAAWDEARRQAVTQKAPDAQASFLLYHVSGRAIAGSCDGASQQVRAALALDKSKTTLVQAVYSAALCGDRSDALPLIAKLNADYPQDTAIQKITLPQSRAALALADHKPADALRELENSRPFDLASDGAYLRGLAYLELGDAANAIDSFQQATKYKGTCLGVGLQDYGQGILGLARAYALAGNKQAARSNYENLLTLWRSADPDLPQLLAAKKEYAAL
jgi:class 3 adenylate cyclase/predicted negative regulator of RcsB-dependent stress response